MQAYSSRTFLERQNEATRNLSEPRRGFQIKYAGIFDCTGLFKKNFLKCFACMPWPKWCLCCVIIRWDLDWIIGFITLIHSTRNYNTVLSLICTLQFTLTNTLGFSVFTSRILATDFITVIITRKVFSSQANLQISTEIAAVSSESS
jgi:hypothetical protein